MVLSSATQNIAIQSAHIIVHSTSSDVFGGSSSFPEFELSRTVEVIGCCLGSYQGQVQENTREERETALGWGSESTLIWMLVSDIYLNCAAPQFVQRMFS